MTTQRNHPALVHGIVDEFAASECNSVNKTLSVSVRNELPTMSYAAVLAALAAEEGRYIRALSLRLENAFFDDPAGPWV